MSVENLVPVLPDSLIAEPAYVGGHGEGRTGSETSNCSRASGVDTYPPGSVLLPALIEVTPSFIMLARNSGFSRVE